MFTPQQGQVEEALRRGGLGADAATEAASAIANCAVALIHRAIIQLDYTPKKFRFITPDLRKFQFPGVDAPVGNPDWRPPSIPLSEGLPTPDATFTEPQDPRPPFGPEQDPGVPPEHPQQTPGGMGPLRPIRVVTDVGYNRRTKRIEVEYSTIYCYFGGVQKVVALDSPKIEVMTNIRLLNNTLIGDKTRVGVVSIGTERKGAVKMYGVECDDNSTGGTGGSGGGTILPSGGV